MTAAEQDAQGIYNTYFRNGSTTAPFLTNVTVTPALQGSTGIDPVYCATDGLAADLLTLLVDAGFDARPMQGPPALEETIGGGQNYSQMVPWIQVFGYNSQNAQVEAHFNAGIIANTINISINKSEAHPRFTTVVGQICAQVQDVLNQTPAQGS